MSRISLSLQFITIFALLILLQSSSRAESSHNCPHTKRVDHKQEFFGSPIHDPYHWLEKRYGKNIDDWIDKQNAYTDQFFERNKSKTFIYRRLKLLSRYLEPEILGAYNGMVAYSYGGYFKKSVAISDTKSGSSARKVLSAADFDKKLNLGTVLFTKAISHDLKLLSYSRFNLKENERFYFRDTETKTDLRDEFDGIQRRPLVFKGHKGVFYAKHGEPIKIFYHQFGSLSNKDKELYQYKKRPSYVRAYYLPARDSLIFVDGGNLVQLDLSTSPISARDLFRVKTKNWSMLGSYKDDLVVKLDGDLWLLDMSNKQEPVILPKLDIKGNLKDVVMKGHYLFYHCQIDAASRIIVQDYKSNSARMLDFPSLGSVDSIKIDAETGDLVFGYEDFVTTPNIISYSYESNSYSSYLPEHLYLNPDKYSIKRVFVDNDGVKIPMFIVHSKSLEIGPKTPLILHGYGGFKHSMVPTYSPHTALWLDIGGVYALACIRGGGEYGESWYKAGIRENKQNSFDDFIACAEWLIEKGYTSKEKLAITGTSNGGLLVGACLTQRPDLFGAACLDSAVLDMLGSRNFNKSLDKFDRSWNSDYGLATTKKNFEILRKYSPYENIKLGTSYPPVLITCPDKDKTISPAHSYKFAAKLQHAQAGSAPILLWVSRGDSHGVNNKRSYKNYMGLENILFLTRVFDMDSEIIKKYGEIPEYHSKLIKRVNKKVK